MQQQYICFTIKAVEFIETSVISSLSLSLCPLRAVSRKERGLKKAIKVKDVSLTETNPGKYCRVLGFARDL
jgi:hypothetical protein